MCACRYACLCMYVYTCVSTSTVYHDIFGVISFPECGVHYFKWMTGQEKQTNKQNPGSPCLWQLGYSTAILTGFYASAKELFLDVHACSASTSLTELSLHFPHRSSLRISCVRSGLESNTGLLHFSYLFWNEEILKADLGRSVNLKKS